MIDHTILSWQCINLTFNLLQSHTMHLHLLKLSVNELKVVKNCLGKQHRNRLKHRLLKSSATPHSIYRDKHPKCDLCFMEMLCHAAIVICSIWRVLAALPWQSSPSTRSCIEAVPDPITTSLHRITHTPGEQVLQLMTTKTNCISCSSLSQIPVSQLRTDRDAAEQPFWSLATKMKKNPRTSHLCSQKQVMTAWDGTV